MTEDWTGRAVDVPPTTFSVTDNGSTQTTIITRPDGAQLTQITDSNQSSATYGMLLEDLLKDNGAVLSHSNAFWEVGAYNSPRPTRTEQYDELGRMTATTYGYDGNSGSLYNSVTDQRAYGYSGELLRRVHTEYLNNGNYNGSLQNSGTLWWKQDGTLSGGPIWGGPHIFNLATLTEIYAEDDATRLSRAEYQYDGSNLTDNPGIVQYDPGTVSQYRGNVTQIKRYADAASLDQSTAVVGARTYDIAGNVRVQTTSCCQQMSFAYTTSTQYAWPDSQTDGSPSDQNTQNITSATYDFNTGLVNTSTDANGRPTTITYDPNTLRPTFEDFSTGAYQSHIYDDLNMVVNDFVYENGQSGSNVASRSDRYFDGLGRVIKEIAYGKDYVQDVVETKFDNMGRVWQQTRPYRSVAETPQWNTVIYDPLNRPTQTTSPDLVSVITRTYNPPDPPNASGQPGQTVKVTDSWGRERWARTDALGRLVEVAEPDPGGSGALSSGTMYTTYDYDALDRLVQVNQDQQTRKFRYDALSRLTHQKLAERDATLDDNGNYVGGGSWSDVFSYDLRSNLTQSVDARGVKTYFKYNNDPLNRLQSVQYDKSGSPANLRANITDAPNVSYGYVTSGDKKRAQSVTVSNGMGNEQLIYDSEGRLAQVSQTFAGRESYPIVTNYIWDSLDRLEENDYPQQYGMGEVRKKVEPAYDIASRLDSVKFGGVTYASNPVYNASSQTTSLNVGQQIVESYGYDAKTGLLTNQQVTRGADVLVNLAYNYTLNNDPNNNGAKTGQLTAVTDLVNPARNRAYEYDKLGRLVKVKGGVNAFANPSWYQTYSYDRYGNRNLVQRTDLSMAPVRPGSQSRSDLIGKIGPGDGGDANRTFSADHPFAVPGNNIGYGVSVSAGAGFSDDDNGGARGGPRVIEEENGSEPFTNGPGGLSRTERPAVATSKAHESANGAGAKSFAKRAAGAAPGAPKKEYGARRGPLAVTPQITNVVTVNPGAHQTPDPGQGGADMVAADSNTGHGATAAGVSVVGKSIERKETRTCLWNSFPNVSGTKTRVTLKFDWILDTSITAVADDEYANPFAEYAFSIDYSLNNGSTWTNRVGYSGSVSIPEGSGPGEEDGGVHPSGSESIDLPNPGSIDITQIRVRDRLYGAASEAASYAGSAYADTEATVSNIRLEVEVVDTFPPVIAGVSSNQITQNSANISWTTNENSDSQVEYGTTTNYGQSTALNSTLVTSHSQGLSGLTLGTLYHYRVKSRDAAGNQAVSNDFTFTTADNTPPVISSVTSVTAGEHQHYFYGATQTLQVNAGDRLYAYVYLDPANKPTEVMLQWCSVEVGCGGNDWVRAYWGANNIGWGTDGTVSRRYIGPLPQAGGWMRLEVPASAVGLEGKTLQGLAFTLNGGRANWDDAGKTNGAGDTVWVDDALPAGAIMGSDGGDSWTWVSSNPTPYSGTVSTQSNLVAGNIGATNATITWNTDENSDSQVEYGLSANYDQATALDGAYVTAHSVDLSGLTAGTLYHYRVKSRDAAGNLAISGDYTFTTTSLPDNTPPVISSVAAVGITATSATITWTTDKNSDSQVEYGTTVSYGQSTTLDSTLVASHSQGLSGLTTGTLYHYRVKSRDAAGNQTVSGDFSFTATQNGSIPLDGLASLSYNPTNNRINSAGFEYDPAGNQTRAAINASGTEEQYLYDSAGRLAQVLDDAGHELASYSYGAGNQRLMSVEGGETKYYAWAGGQIIAEYEATGTSGLVWKTSYVYFGGQLLATTTGADGNETRFHHPDRLGTRLVTDAGGEVVSEQLSMPYGTMLSFSQVYGGEGSYQNPGIGNPSKKRFTSYERSEATGLDYAVNRHYSSAQGRFTQVDPLEMGAVSLSNPQTLNLYAYCGNDPINQVDPAGTSFFGALFGWIGKIFKWVAVAVIVAVAVLTVVSASWAGTVIGSIVNWAGNHQILASIFGLSGKFGSFGTPPFASGFQGGNLPDGYSFDEQGALTWLHGAVVLDSVTITSSRDTIAEFIHEMGIRGDAMEGMIGYFAASGFVGGVASGLGIPAVYVGVGGLWAQDQFPDNPFPIFPVGVGGGGLTITNLNEGAVFGTSARLTGDVGESLSGLVKNTERIPSLSRTANYRVPDGLDKLNKVISEVKNVKRLGYTKQLIDYTLYAKKMGYTFELYVRPTTRLTGPLQEAVVRGDIVLKYLW